MDPGGEGFGEGSVVAAGVVEVVGGVDEGGGWCRVSGRPGVPDVEGVELLFGVGEPILVSAEAARELLVDLAVLLQPVLFLTELVALVEQWLDAAGEFVKRGTGSGDTIGGLGHRVAGGAAVETAGGGEFSFGIASALLGVAEVAGGAADGVVVRGAVWFEVGELSAELVDALSELGVALLFGCVGGACVGEFGSGGVVEVGEPVGDLASRPQRRCGWEVGGEFLAGVGGGVVGAVGGEDAFEDVDGVGDVVGVGDDADEVLAASAGDGDVQPATGGGGGGEGDGGSGGVGLVAGFGGGVAELRVFGDVVGGLASDISGRKTPAD